MGTVSTAFILASTARTWVRVRVRVRVKG